jgi:Domain of unknown function (DUF4376)
MLLVNINIIELLGAPVKSIKLIGIDYTVQLYATDAEIVLAKAANSTYVASDVPQIADVNRWRHVKELGGFSYHGKTWQSDALSAQRIMGAAILSATTPGYSQAWTAADNSVVVLDATGIQGMLAALGTHVATVFATASAAKAAIRSATTIEQIDAALATLK